ncbi:hypothetical protein CEP51_015378 [Fusarium floridanum]|uniref:Uncharacterized protein n=1 Tax=Fusarium floridanum TaxID=1325733 RepID=A0A428PB57_9HYPO|nr:hypothetical protein CEP51_015378 [Fusarium floridanum]
MKKLSDEDIGILGEMRIEEDHAVLDDVRVYIPRKQLSSDSLRLPDIIHELYGRKFSLIEIERYLDVLGTGDINPDKNVILLFVFHQSAKHEMEYNVFHYCVMQRNSCFSSRSIDNIAYITRYGDVNSIRSDHDRFLQVLGPKLHRFNVEEQRIQHFMVKHTGFEIYIEFSGWRRFAELTWEGERACKATAEFPRGFKQVMVELRRESDVRSLGQASREFPTYSPDDNDIFSTIFDPEGCEDFSVVFTASNGPNDIRVISKPLTYRGPLCKADRSRATSPDGLVCVLKLRPDLLKTNFPPAGDRIDGDSPETLDLPNHSESRDEVEEIERADSEPRSTMSSAEGPSESTVLVTMKEIETTMKGWMSSDQQSYTMSELCKAFPGHEPATLTRAWYRVHEDADSTRRIENYQAEN